MYNVTSSCHFQTSLKKLGMCCTMWVTNEQSLIYFAFKIVYTTNWSFCLFILASVGAQVKLAALKLDEHASDKLLRLVGDRYDNATDTLTIVTNRCPTRKQNYDYAMYLLTVLCLEANVSRSSNEL